MKQTSESLKPMCSLPWFQVDIRYTGYVQPCCMMGAIGSIHDDDILSIWNGNNYRFLRHKLATHDLQGTPCEHCAHRLSGSWQAFPEYALKDDLIRKANFDKAQEHYRNGDVLLTSKPVSYRMDVTNECNLNCIMCDQNHDPKTYSNRFPKSFIDHFFIEGLFELAGEIVLVGGEPLFVPESVEILKSAAELGPGECQLNLQTNGLLIDKYWNEIKAFRNAYFAISMDGCSANTYEKIRRGGSWNTLVTILEKLKITIAAEGWRKWNIYHAHVVMRSNILELPRMLEFAHKYGAGVGFSPMYDTDNRQENIFLFNWLLEDIITWKQVLDQSIELAGALGFNALARESLILIGKLLMIEPWITKEMELQIRQQEGIEGLRRIFYHKVRLADLYVYPPTTATITFLPMSLVPGEERVSDSQECENTKVSTNEMLPTLTDCRRCQPELRLESLLTTIAASESRLYYRDQTVESLNALLEAVASYQPTKVVELGTLSGVSLRTWLNADPSLTVTAIDLSFDALLRSKSLLPFDSSRVVLVQQDILSVDFSSLWTKEDRVLFYVDAHDDHGVPIMDYVLRTALPALPAGSVVMVDDLWYSADTLDESNIQSFFDTIMLDEIDPLQCFDGYYASYWKGGSFFGFLEVIPLLEWVNSNRVELAYRSGIKSVAFSWGGA